MADCFTGAQETRWGLTGLTDAEILRKLNDDLIPLKNTVRQSKMSALIYDRELAKLDTYRLNGRKNLQAAYKALVYTDRSEAARFASVEANMRAVNGWSQSQIYDMMETFSPTVGQHLRATFGQLDRRTQSDFVKAIFGDRVDNPEFTRMAQDWKKLTALLRERYNKAGGDIKLLDDWNLPQHHDAGVVSKAGKDKWIEDIVPLLDEHKMRIFNFTPGEKRAFYSKIYDNIATEGLASLEPGTYLGVSKIAQRHQERRVLHFKDADSWLAYSENYSNATPYSAMMDHVSMLSNEIGLMETLGPNPDHMFEKLGQVVQKDAAKSSSYKGDPSVSTGRAERAYTNLAGHTSPTNRKLSNTMQALRNYETAAKLPGATLSALPDVLFNGLTAHYNGVPVTATLGRFIKNLNPKNKADQKLASELWMPLDHLLDTAHSAMRFTDAAGTGARKTANLASAVMKGSWLDQWTVAGKSAFHVEFMGALADPNLMNNPNILKAMDRYGIEGADVGRIINSTKLVKEGVEYLDPARLPQPLAEKVVAMITAETKYAVPEADSLVRGVLNQGTRKGDVGGEVLRAMTQFKTFPATIAANHLMRGYKGHMTAASYYGTMVLGTTALGMIVVQAKAIVKGKEPLPVGNQLVMEGFRAGGSMSIMADLLSKDARGYGGSLQDFLLGPLGSDANKLFWDGMLGTVDDARENGIQIDQIIKDSVGELPGYVPGQIWQIKLVLDKTLWDASNRWADPEYDLKQAEKEAQRQEEIAQGGWF